MIKIGIVVLNWNGLENTKECIKSLKKINKSGFETEIIIVDNASKDQSAEKIRKENKEVKIVENDTNLGFALGNNKGIEEALKNNCDYVYILNNDMVVDSLVISNLLKTAQNNNAGIVSPKIYFYKGFEFHKSKYKENELGKIIWFAGGVIDWKNVFGHHLGVDQVDRGQFDKDCEIDYATGASMFINKRVLEKTGLFDQKYFLYYEDLDFSLRAKQSGEKIYYSFRAVAWHKNAGSSYSGSNLQDYYISRNRIIFGIKYAPFNTKIALIKEALRLMLKGRRWQKKGIVDFFLCKFGKGSYE